MKHALTLSAADTGREASAVRLLHLAMEDRNAAMAGALEHLEDWPCDAIVFSLLIGPFGLFSSSGRRDWREASLALMERHRPALPADDWWFLSNLSFSQAEAGQSALALEIGEHALGLRSTGLAAHSVSHAQLELGMKDEGLRFARDWLAGPGRASDMRHHISWHAAVFEYDLKVGDAGHPQHELAATQMRGGFGGLLTFELKAGLSGSKRFMDSLSIPSIAISLGSVDSLVQCPALMTHSNMSAEDLRTAGITEGQIRLSVGIENIEDLMGDILQALDQV
jgi:hypothetical protein